MSMNSYALRDSRTMLRRSMLHSLRYPMMTLSGVLMPAFFLLLFDGVFGGALRTSIGGVASLGGRYIDYLVPGIIVLTACAGAEVTAVNVSTDMTEGIIARFRTMAITRTSVLTGQVLGSLILNLIAVVFVVAIALALGFRPNATPGEWVAAIALFALLTLALTWLAVAFGLVAKTPAGANSMSLILLVLPFVSSAYVPTSSMPAGVRWFAQNQPFTQVIDTLRSLLTGTPAGQSAIIAVAWLIAISALGFLWARARYNQAPAH